MHLVTLLKVILNMNLSISRLIIYQNFQRRFEKSMRRTKVHFVGEMKLSRTTAKLIRNLSRCTCYRVTVLLRASTYHLQTFLNTIQFVLT